MPGIYGPTTPVDEFVIDSFGVRGPAGLSAYQIWLQAGNTGSTADFLASLQPQPNPAAIAAAVLAALPTSAPVQAGRLWNSGGHFALS